MCAGVFSRSCLRRRKPGPPNFFGWASTGVARWRRALGRAAGEPHSRERGIGHALMGELIESLRAMGVGSLQSLANWTNHDLLRFFEASGFTLAPRLPPGRAGGGAVGEASGEGGGQRRGG